MKPISADKRNNIIRLLEDGLSSREIATLVGLHRSTIDSIRKQVMPDAPKPASGRPAKLSARDRRNLARLVTSGKADTAVQLQKELRSTAGIHVSAQTVRNALKGEGLKAAVKRKKPLLLPRHIKQRYEFALKYQYWTEEDWCRVIFSDETKINRLGSDGRKWVWKTPGSRITQQHVVGTVKYGGGCIMLWGCMTARGVGFMCRIDGRMDAELYTSILDDYVFPTLDYYEMDRDDFVFQQDNDPKHTSRMAQEWFEANEVELLDWPAQSPDINPIEHLWQHLKRKLADYETAPSSMHELWQRVETEWEKIPKEVCLDLIKSMPRRISAVLKAKGGYTKY
jgi:transposase